MSQFGISQRTATSPVTLSSVATIHAEPFTPRENFSWGQERELSFEQTQEMPSLSGGTPSIAPTNKLGSSVRYSGMKGRTNRQSLSDRLTQSLITAGLVRGITPLSIRRQSGAAIQDFVLLPLVGGEAGSLQKVFTYSSVFLSNETGVEVA